ISGGVFFVPFFLCMTIPPVVLILQQEALFCHCPFLLDLFIPQKESFPFAPSAQDAPAWQRRFPRRFRRSGIFTSRRRAAKFVPRPWRGYPLSMG
ncbi:MAG: hypothetical protein LBM18_02975, partial [Oscillospiraceae bacterium]|nr:hypothetical protein [Oscillospiraceae bacterium]